MFLPVSCSCTRLSVCINKKCRNQRSGPAVRVWFIAKANEFQTQNHHRRLARSPVPLKPSPKQTFPVTQHLICCSVWLQYEKAASDVPVTQAGGSTLFLLSRGTLNISFKNPKIVFRILIAFVSNTAFK